MSHPSASVAHRSPRGRRVRAAFTDTSLIVPNFHIVVALLTRCGCTEEEEARARVGGCDSHLLKQETEADHGPTGVPKHVCGSDLQTSLIPTEEERACFPRFAGKTQRPRLSPLQSFPRDHLQVVCLVGSAKRRGEHLRGQQHCRLAGGVLRGQLGRCGVISGQSSGRRLVPINPQSHR